MALSDEKYLYNVFIVHSSEDNEKAREIDIVLQDASLKTYAHYRSGSDNADDKTDGFFVGKFVTDNIRYAVNKSRLVLILVTKNAVSSGWVTYEIILSVEKSLTEDSVCVRLVFEGMTEEEIKLFKSGDFEFIPSFVLDFQHSSWKSDLVQKINEPNPKLRHVLPAGNVAHGLVFNYFTGFLRNVLPRLEEAINSTDYKDQPLTHKFVIIIPTSCHVMRIDGQYGDVVIKKMDKTVEISASHGDKFRPYNLSVYCVTKGEQSFYFLGECPFIIETMPKIAKFVDVGANFLKYQVERFRKTLMDLVNHHSNLKCNNTVRFVDFEDTAEGQTLGDKLWDVVRNEVVMETQEVKGCTRFVRHVGSRSRTSQSSDKEYFATITNDDNATDKQAAMGVQSFLSDQEVRFTNGNGHSELNVLSKADWNIFIVSKGIQKNNCLQTQLNAAIQESIDNNKIQVIPIVSKDTDMNQIPDHVKWVTCLQEKEDGSHLQHMWDIMTGEPQSMKEMLPSGPVYQGYAYAYMLNYLAIGLTAKTKDGKGFRERFADAVHKYDLESACVPRVFLITPASCQFPPPGTQFKNEKFVGDLEPAMIGPRKYDLKLFELTMKNGKKVCYAREYTTPSISLHEMAHKYPFAGMNTDDMKVQASEFVKLCTAMTRNEGFTTEIGDISDKCELVYFDDEKEELPDALERELQVFLDSEEFISPNYPTSA